MAKLLLAVELNIIQIEIYIIFVDRHKNISLIKIE